MEQTMQAFFAALDRLVGGASLRIDRPCGSAHPRFPEVIYPVDYGYLEGTSGGDNEGVDVFRGTASGAGIVGIVLTADLTKRDVEVKILLDCSTDEIEAIEHLLHERLRLNSSLVRRP
ncbi:inorganic pyrophosphatase [Rhodococcus hoagii]|nr:inorganic pyrophosphatase [Prescottella equi]MBU4616020.1 inorganic pyrophosphatase [Rhodococcus sp. GG48]NKS35387.1 inorganic pyrophosphatase [Prescottella equi]